MQSYDNTITLRDFGIFLSHSRNFHSNGDVTIVGKGLKIGTSPLSSEGFLACHNNCGTGHPFIKWSSPRIVTLTPVAKCFAAELSLPVFMPPPPRKQSLGGILISFYPYFFFFFSPFYPFVHHLSIPLSLLIPIFVYLPWRSELE